MSIKIRPLHISYLLLLLCCWFCPNFAGANNSFGSQKIIRPKTTPASVREKMILSVLASNNITRKEQYALTDSLYKINPKNVDYVLKFADAAMMLGEFEQAEAALDQAVKLSGKEDLPLYCRIKWNQVQLNRMQGKIVNAVVDASELLNIKKPDSLQYLNVDLNLFLADGYLNLGSLKLSQLYLEDAQKLFKAKGNVLFEDKRSDIQNHLYAVEAQNKLYTGEKEKALNLVLEAMKYKASPTNQVYLKLLTGAIYEELGEYTTALKTYKEIIDTPDASWWNAMALPRYINMLGITDSKYDLDALLAQYSDFVHMIHNTHRGITMDHIRARRLYETGSTDEAWNTLEDAYTRLEQFAFYHAHSSRQADVIYDIMSVKQQEYQDKLRKATILIIVAVFLFVALFVSFFFLLRKLRQKKAQIDALNTTYTSKLAQLEENKQTFEEQLDNRSHEMMGVTIMLARVNDLIENIKTRINGRTSADDKVKEIRDIIVKSEIGENSDRMLKVQFSHTHGNLLDRLTEKHPNITDGEQKLSIYMILGYTTREIAEMTFRSPRSVETMKYRLSKKVLDPSASQSLEEYIRSFCDN